MNKICFAFVLIAILFTACTPKQSSSPHEAVSSAPVFLPSSSSSMAEPELSSISESSQIISESSQIIEPSSSVSEAPPAIEPTLEECDWEGFKFLVVDTKGNPISNMKFYFREMAHEGKVLRTQLNLGPTNEKGEFIFKDVNAGWQSYFIGNSEVGGEYAEVKQYQFVLEEARRHLPVTVVWDKETPKETAMKLENKLVLKFKDTDGKPMAGIHLVLSQFTDEEIRDSEHWYAYTDTEGTFVLAQPEIQTYCISATYPDPKRVHINDCIRQTYTAEVTGEGTFEYEFVWEPD